MLDKISSFFSPSVQDDSMIEMSAPKGKDSSQEASS